MSVQQRRLEFDPRADRQIDEAYLWWAKNHSPEQAGRWFWAISKKIDALVQTAERCSLAPEDHKFPYEVRQMLFGLGRRPTHRVLFTIKPDNNIYVLAVRHVSQRLLKPEDFAE